MSNCEMCGGSGVIPLGDGIRGIKICPICHGKGKVENMNNEKSETDDKKLKLLRRFSESAIPIGGIRLLDFREVAEIVEEIL